MDPWSGHSFVETLLPTKRKLSLHLERLKILTEGVVVLGNQRLKYTFQPLWHLHLSKKELTCTTKPMGECSAPMMHNREPCFTKGPAAALIITSTNTLIEETR